MTRTTRYLLFVLMSLFLSACVTTRDCLIETLQPAKLTFSEPKHHVAICASPAILSDAIKANEGASGVATDSIIRNILFSLQHFCEGAPGFENAQYFVAVVKDDAFPSDSKFDMVLRLDKLDFKNSYYGEQYSYTDWEAYLQVVYAAKWSVRNKSGLLIDEYTDRDMLTWQSGIRPGKSEAVMSLPKIGNAWWDAGIAMAKSYAVRIVPQWQKENRQIYMINKFPDLSTLAYKSMQNSGYARAFGVWENMLLSCRKRGQHKMKSRITYNMAVACEFQNQLNEAIHWAEQSANYSKNSKITRYLSHLRERQQQSTQLDQQTTQPDLQAIP